VYRLQLTGNAERSANFVHWLQFSSVQ